MLLVNLDRRPAGSKWAGVAMQFGLGQSRGGRISRIDSRCVKRHRLGTPSDRVTLQTLGASALSETLTELMERKSSLRRTAYDARNAQEDKDRLSELAVAKLMELPEYQAS